MASEIDACMQNACRKVLEDFDFNLGHEQCLDMTKYGDLFVAKHPRRFTKVVNGMHSNSLFAMHWPLAA